MGRDTHVRIEASVTSISWIPLGAVEGATRLAFDWGIAHYDLPPPDRIDDLERLRIGDAFRFANELRAWIEVEDGQVVGYGHAGKAHVGSTRLRLGGRALVFQAVALPEIRPEPEVGRTWVRFTQTAGGRTGVPMPRAVVNRPFVQIVPPVAWTTLALTIHADGSATHKVEGASPFPRHWIYDQTGTLAAKTGFIDFDTWYRRSFGRHSPWGEEDSPAIVTAVETALERELSAAIIGSKPPFRRLRRGEALVRQGEPGDELFLLFDGILVAEIDGKPIAEVGPGAILGEMALLREGKRIATLRAVTPCRVAVVPSDHIDKQVLAQVAEPRWPPEKP
jgi:Cyclic nucleotide-binding domain